MAILKSIVSSVIVNIAYLNSHGIPFLLPEPIPRNIICLREQEQEYNQNIDYDKMRVAIMI
jgi:hypothetical protein